MSAANLILFTTSPGYLLFRAIPHKDSAADAPAQSLRSRVSFGNNYHSDR